MSNLKISSQLFLEEQELNRLVKFLSIDKSGYKSFIKNLTYNSGIIRLKDDINLLNFKIESGTNSKTIKISSSYALDSDLNIIFKEQEDNIVIPNDGNWYWVKIGKKSTHVEEGTVSIDKNGNLVGNNTKFTEVLRGTNFPPKVKFYNTFAHYDDYEVLQVIDDTNAIISGDFIEELNLKYSVIGAFTDGYVPNIAIKEIYTYDSCYDFKVGEGLILETVFNTPPPKLDNEFYIARVKVLGNNVLIEDKREDFWQLKSDYNFSYVDRALINNMMGVEFTKWDLEVSPKNENFVRIGWGFRTNNWTIEPSLRKITINAGFGGKYKDTSYFSNNDFTGFRIYALDGSWQKIIDSFKSGSSINIILDVLNPDKYLLNDELIIVPDVEEIGIKVEGIKDNTQDKFEQVTTINYFPVREGYADIKVEHPLKDANSLYKIKITHSYKVFKSYTEWINLPDDILAGYYDETSFLLNGNLKPLANVVNKIYSNSIIKISANPKNYGLFAYTIDKGDLFEVEAIDMSTANFTQLDLIVGTSKYYQYFYGKIDLTSDIVINLSTPANIREGNRFVIQFDCLPNFKLNTQKISICQNYTGPSSVNLIKDLVAADFYAMSNVEKGGIRFDLIFDIDTGKWICSCNYTIEKHFEIVQFDGVLSDMFNLSTGLGKVKGWYGYALCNKNYTVDGTNIPNLSGRFLLGNGILGTNNYPYQITGGEAEHKLIVTELPKMKIKIPASPQRGEGGLGWVQQNNQGDGDLESREFGGDVSHNNMPPYYTLAMAKKIF